MEDLNLIPLQEGDNHIYTQEQVDRDSRTGTYNGKSLPKRGIYKAFVPLKENPHLYKVRPVIMFSNSLGDSKKVDIIPVTSSVTNENDISNNSGASKTIEYKFYQIPFFKYPILKWRENFLEIPSYAVIDYNKGTKDFYSTLDKRYILEPIKARKHKDYNEFLMDEPQFNEILNIIDSLSIGENPFEDLNPKLDPYSEYFDWRTMGIPEFEWKKYRKDVFTGKTEGISKEQYIDLKKDPNNKNKPKISWYRLLLRNDLKREFMHLNRYYLYNLNSRIMGEQYGKILTGKDTRSKKYVVLKDWNTYESHMGKYFPIINELKNEIVPEYFSLLPTENTNEFKEHILSDEELKKFIEDSLI